MGKKGKGWPTSPLGSATASPARGEKKVGSGALLVGLQPKGQARGPATAPWLPAPPSSLSVARAVLLC